MPAYKQPMGSHRRLPLLPSWEGSIIQEAMTFLPNSIVPSTTLQGKILPREAGRHPVPTSDLKTHGRSGLIHDL